MDFAPLMDFPEKGPYQAIGARLDFFDAGTADTIIILAPDADTLATHLRTHHPDLKFSRAKFHAAALTSLPNLRPKSSSTKPS